MEQLLQPCAVVSAKELLLYTSLPEGAEQGELPLPFFAWLAHVPSELAERIRSSLPDDRRAPEGLGLDRIRGDSYALTVPAKQNGLCYGFGGMYAATTSDNLRGYC